MPWHRNDNVHIFYVEHRLLSLIKLNRAEETPNARIPRETQQDPKYARRDLRQHENEVTPVFTPSARELVYHNRAHKQKFNPSSFIPIPAKMAHKPRHTNFGIPSQSPFTIVTDICVFIYLFLTGFMPLILCQFLEHLFFCTILKESGDYPRALKSNVSLKYYWRCINLEHIDVCEMKVFCQFLLISQ